ncbi:MAG: hypothetical protein ACTSWW_11985 [Promethearchaeota archaeon]
MKKSASHTQSFSLSIKNYPSKILLGDQPYTFEFFTQNQLPAKEKYQMVFRGENLEIKHTNSADSKRITYEGNESKIINVTGIPQRQTGEAKLFIEVMHEQTEMVTEVFWKARAKIEHEEIDPILKESSLIYNNLVGAKDALPKSIDLGDSTPLSESEARVKMQDINETQFEMDMEKDRVLIGIARAVFMQAPKYGYEVVHQIHNPNLRQTLLYHFIPVGMGLDYQTTLPEIMLVSDEAEQTNFLVELGQSIASEHPKDAAMVAMNIGNNDQRNGLMKDIIYTNSFTNPEIASNLTFQISDNALRNHVLFDLVEIWGKHDPQKAAAMLKTCILDFISEQNLDFIKKCLMFLALLTTPEVVLELMTQIEGETRDFLEKHLKKFLKIKVKERRKRTKMVPVLQQYYAFSAIGDPISPSMQYMADLGGNISLDLLQMSATPQLLVVAPYHYKFPLYQMLQQINFQIQQDLKQPLSFIVFPSKKNLEPNGEEWTHLIHIFEELKLKTPSKASHPVIILHLDFIPHLPAPTVIFGELEDGSESAGSTQKTLQIMINERLNAHIGNAVHVLWNRPFLQRSKFTTNFLPPHFIVLNTLLTYNFLNDPGLLGAFFKALIPISSSIPLPKKK